MTMPEKAAMWQLRAKIRVSAGPHVAMMAAWMPTVVPFTKNQVLSALKALAASACASLMGPVGEDR